MNALFQEYKRQVDECRVVFVDHLDLDFRVEPIELHIDEKGKGHYNRMDQKEETQKLIDEYYKGDDDEER